MLDAELNHLITLHPERGSLPVAVVQAICMVESTGNEWANRFEPGFRYLVGDANSLSPTERTNQMISWGLMQVMGAVAREHGYKGPLPKLCDPYTGLTYGMRHLARYYAKYNDWPQTIASYNAGSPRVVGSKFVNQSYVDKVLRAWAELEVPIPIKESEV